MKFIAAMAAAACTLVGTIANAARFEVEPLSGSPTGVYSFYLRGESTTFDGVYFSSKPLHGAQFLNVNSGIVGGMPRLPGDSFTYRNRLLDADVSDHPDSKEWTLLVHANTASEIAFSGGPLGRAIDTNNEPDGRLFLANVKLSIGALATATLHLVHGGSTVFSARIPEPIPEPASLALAAASLLTLISIQQHRSATAGNVQRLGQPRLPQEDASALHHSHSCLLATFTPFICTANLIMASSIR
jgi:hypothetical protein